MQISVTTHYIEVRLRLLSILLSSISFIIYINIWYNIKEAKNANKIGLMRSGRLLAENSPSNLLKAHQCISLEDVFLKLCMKDKSNNSALTMPPVANNNSAINSHLAPLNSVGGMNLVSVYDKNRQSQEDNVAINTFPENGIVGLTFLQSNEQLVDGNPNSNVSSNPGMDCKTAIKHVTEDCSNCLSHPWSFDFKNPLNRLTALTLKNFICMWRNIG